MKRAVVCLFILMPAALCFSQGNQKPSQQSRPDLSGTWELNRAKSDLEDVGGESAVSEVAVIILQHDPEFRVTRRRRSGSFEIVGQALFYTDGRGEANRLIPGREDIKSTTKWEGKKVVTVYTLRRTLPGSVITMDVTDEWKLSDDGRTLTLRTILRYPRGAAGNTIYNPRTSTGGTVYSTTPRREIKRVYNRVS